MLFAIRMGLLAGAVPSVCTSGLNEQCLYLEGFGREYASFMTFLIPFSKVFHSFYFIKRCEGQCLWVLPGFEPPSVKIGVNNGIEFLLICFLLKVDV